MLHGPSCAQRITGRLLPTVGVGSYALPGWVFAAREWAEQGKLGTAEVREAYQDAVRIAVADQLEAGLDVVSEGEMGRDTFIGGFYARFTGLQREAAPAYRTGTPAYYHVPIYDVIEPIGAPAGLGLLEEFRLLKQLTDRPAKIACPGPFTLTFQTRIRGGYTPRDYRALANDFADIINAELRALVAEGATFIQIDEISPSIRPVGLDEVTDLFNRCLEGVDATIGWHICFGNNQGRPFGRRTYREMIPAALAARADVFFLEFANRGLAELELCAELAAERDVAVGVIDVKLYHCESPDEVAEALRAALRYVPAERLWATLDCGLFATPRWLARRKLESLVHGAAIVRAELEGERVGSRHSGVGSADRVRESGEPDKAIADGVPER